MIFVILGTQDKTFPRLLEAVEKQIEKGNIKDKVIAQAGSTKFESDKMEIVDFMSVEEFNNNIEKADIIITHAGVGTILTALNKNKKIIAAARLKKYGEHVNDHQLQIVEKFSDEGYVLPLEDFDRLDEIIKKAKEFKPNKFVSNKQNFLDNIKREIDES